MRPRAIEVKGEINGVPTCLQSTIKTGKDPFPDLGRKKIITIQTSWHYDLSLLLRQMCSG